MTAMDRTAYPRSGERLTREELRARILKTRQNLGCFPALRDVHADTVACLALQIEMSNAPPLHDKKRGKTTLHRYRTAVRAYLGVTAYADAGERLVTSTILEVAETMSDPADLINRAICQWRTASRDPHRNFEQLFSDRLQIFSYCRTSDVE